MPQGRQQSNTVPTWATSAKKHTVNILAPNTSKFIQTTARSLPTSRQGTRPDKHVCWGTAMSSRRRGSAAAQRPSDDRRADYCTIGSSDETVRMCVSRPFGSTDESMADAESTERFVSEELL